MPVFMILKHSKSSEAAPDQTGMTVIAQLHKRDTGFGVSNGYTLLVWILRRARQD